MASFTKPHLRHGPYDSQPFIRSFTAAASSTRWKGLSRHIPKGQRSSQEWRQCQWCMEKAIRKAMSLKASSWLRNPCLASQQLLEYHTGSLERILKVVGTSCMVSLALALSILPHPKPALADTPAPPSYSRAGSARVDQFPGHLPDPISLDPIQVGSWDLAFAISPDRLLGSRPHTAETGVQEEAANEEEGRELVREVWEVIALKYADVRGGGFSLDRWAQLRDDALRKPLKDEAAAYRAIRTMLAEGVTDRFTRFVPREQFASMNSYDITGVGLNLSTAAELEDKANISAKKPGLYVLGLISQSAAKRAGIGQGDQILEVDGVAITNQSPFEAAAMIQSSQDGSARPSVTIKVRKARSDRDVEYNLQRAVVGADPSPVTAKLVTLGNRRIGSIKLDKFVARSQPDVASAVRRLSADGAEEFVLDLRNNLGGLVEEGVEVARLFLDGNATIVNRLDNGGIQRRTASGSQPLTHAPVTLLVNERTASASEIFAGALQDNCRAVVVGSRTYGKGLIQSVYQLENGSALVVTIGKYLTPARTDIDREGLKPDFSSIPGRESADERLAACRIRPAA